MQALPRSCGFCCVFVFNDSILASPFSGGLICALVVLCWGWGSRVNGAWVWKSRKKVSTRHYSRQATFSYLFHWQPTTKKKEKKKRLSCAEFWATLVSLNSSWSQAASLPRLETRYFVKCAELDSLAFRIRGISVRFGEAIRKNGCCSSSLLASGNLREGGGISEGTCLEEFSSRSSLTWIHMETSCHKIEKYSRPSVFVLKCWGSMCGY